MLTQGFEVSAQALLLDGGSVRCTAAHRVGADVRDAPVPKLGEVPHGCTCADRVVDGDLNWREQS